MKICPTCNSSYTDETLIFCLTDGTLLVVDDAEAENFPDDIDLPEAKTIFDKNLKIHQPASFQTLTLSDSSTTPQLQLKTNTFTTQKPNQTRPFLYPLLGVLGMVCAAAGIFWWLYSNNSANLNVVPKQAITDSSGVKRPRVTAPLTSDQETLIKREVTDLLEAWRKSIEKRDADANVKFYTKTLETYYRESGIDRNHVRADRQRAIDRYESLSIEIDKLKITPETSETASAVFDKSWTFKNPVKTSTGSVQQEMYFVKQNDKWLINGEKDAKVHFINNRENSETEANSNTDPNK